MRWVRATFGEAVSSRTSPAVADDSSPPRIKRSPSRTDSSGHKWPRAAVAPQLRVSHADEMQQELRHGSTLRRKVCALRMLSPFGAYMTEKELERLAKACAFCNIRLGAELTDSPFYVLICGRVAVKRASDEDVICTKQQGAFFTRRVGMGQVGQRSELSISTRLVGAADRSKVLLVTSSHMLGQFYSEVSTLGREAFVDVCASNIGTQLNEVPFIKEARLMPRDLVQLGELCSYLAVPAGARIFEEGDEATSFYIILKGKVASLVNENTLSVENDADADSEVYAGVRCGGETFGVAAMVYNARTRKYGMEAKETTLLLVISRENFRAFLATSPRLHESLMTSTRHFLVQRHSAYKHSIFRRTTPEMKETIARKSKLVNYAEGQPVYHRGAQPVAFYIVAHGEVGMSFDGEGGDHLTQTTLGPGKHFGEFGLLLQDKPCIATVHCTQDTTLLVLEVPVFVEIFSAAAFELRVELLIKLEGKKCDLRTALHHADSHAAFVRFAVALLGNESVPVGVYNAVQRFLQRESVASSAMPGLRPITRQMVNRHLHGELNAIVKEAGVFLIARGSVPADAPDLQTEYQLNALQESLEELHSGVQFVQSTSQVLAEALPLLHKVERSFRGVLEAAWPHFVESACFDALLDQIGAYDDLARRHVSPADTQDIVDSIARRDLEERLLLVDGSRAGEK